MLWTNIVIAKITKVVFITQYFMYVSAMKHETMFHCLERDLEYGHPVAVTIAFRHC